MGYNRRNGALECPIFTHFLKCSYFRNRQRRVFPLVFPRTFYVKHLLMFSFLSTSCKQIFSDYTTHTHTHTHTQIDHYWKTRGTVVLVIHNKKFCVAKKEWNVLKRSFTQHMHFASITGSIEGSIVYIDFKLLTKGVQILNNPCLQNLKCVNS